MSIFDIAKSGKRLFDAEYAKKQKEGTTKATSATKPTTNPADLAVSGSNATGLAAKSIGWLVPSTGFMFQGISNLLNNAANSLQPQQQQQQQQQPGSTQQQGSPLPSSNYSGPKNIPQVNMGQIRDRAGRDARMQIEALRQQANQGYGRFKSDVESQLEALRLAYSGEYDRINRDTQRASRDALQRAAMRGFVTDGMAMGADLKANLEGQQMESATRNNELSQAQTLEKMLAQQGIEYNDIMANLGQKEQDLILKLIDDYTLRDRENNLKEYSLTSDTALKLLGMDTDWRQFQDSLNWDKERFGTEMGQRQSEFDRQYGFQNRSLDAQIANQLAQQQLQRDQMSMQDRWWEGDDKWRRDNLSEQLGFNRDQLQWERDRWEGDDAYRRDMMDMQDTWNTQENAYRQGQLGLAQDQFEFDKTWRGQQTDAGQADRDWAMNQLTAKYMDTADSILSKLSSNPSDPELLAFGIDSPDDILSYFKDRGMKITSEGANLDKVIQYVRQRAGLPTGNVQGGPVRDPMSVLDPLGINRRNSSSSSRSPYYFGR